MEAPGRTQANLAGDTMDMPRSTTEDKQSPVAGLCKHIRRRAQSASERVLQNLCCSLRLTFGTVQGQISHHWGTCHLGEVPSASPGYTKLFFLNACYLKSGALFYCGTFLTIRKSFLLFELPVSL